MLLLYDIHLQNSMHLGFDIMKQRHIIIQFQTNTLELSPTYLHVCSSFVLFLFVLTNDTYPKCAGDFLYSIMILFQNHGTCIQSD